MVGRPSSFSQDIADTICERIANGESLRRICKGNGMPDIRTVMRWLSANEEFCQQYTRAREIQADVFFDEMIDIADDKSVDCQRGKLMFEVRKWVLARMSSRKYGDKQHIDHTSSDGSMSPVAHEEVINKITNLLSAVKRRNDS